MILSDRLKPAEVLLSLKNLKQKWTNGPDEKHAFIVRNCAYALLNLFQKYLICHYRQVPNIWKKSEVCPVFKNGKKLCRLL